MRICAMMAWKKTVCRYTSHVASEPGIYPPTLLAGCGAVEPEVAGSIADRISVSAKCRNSGVLKFRCNLFKKRQVVKINTEGSAWCPVLPWAIAPHELFRQPCVCPILSTE